MQVLNTLINRLDFTEEEQDALRLHFCGNEKRQKDAVAILSRILATFGYYYLLYDLMKNNATIVYDHYDINIVFNNGNGYYFNKKNDNIRKYLQNKNTWYIVNRKVLRKASAKTI